jgi:hypothetical protein
MALRTPKTDLHPSTIQRTFLAAGLATAVVLADQLEASGATSPAGAPGPGIDHMPSAMFVGAGAGQILEWTDLLGNANSFTFVAAYTGPLPWSARTIGGGATNVAFLVVLWHPEA